jgi:hypothetical protein
MTTQIIAHAFDYTISKALEESPDAWDVINCWCLDRDSNAVLIKISDMPNFF